MIIDALSSLELAETVTILDCDFISPSLPFPPQLPQALGFPLPTGQRLGVWRELEGVAVSDGLFIHISPDSAWDAYCLFPRVFSYLDSLRKLGVNLLDNELEPCSNWGFLIDTDRLLIGQIKFIKYLVYQNPDRRPDWIKKATLEDWKNPEWVKQFGKWHIQKTEEFQKNLLACEPAIDGMMEWLKKQESGKE